MPRFQRDVAPGSRWPEASASPASPTPPIRPTDDPRARPRAAARARSASARSLVPRERRRHADVMERALVVEQPEQERSDVGARPVLVPAESGDDAVGRSLVLDLQHRPLARLVLVAEALRDDAIEPCALEPMEPVLGEGSVRRGRREMDRRRRGAQRRFQAASGARPGASRAGPRRRARAGPTRRTTRATPRPASSTREAAGWMRRRRASNCSSPSFEITTSPSRMQRSGSAARSGSASSGK